MKSADENALLHTVLVIISALELNQRENVDLTNEKWNNEAAKGLGIVIDTDENVKGKSEPNRQRQGESN